MCCRPACPVASCVPTAAFFLFFSSVRLACQSTSQQYYSLILNQHQPPATSQSAVLFSHNKSATAISHSQANTVARVTISASFCLFQSFGRSRFQYSVTNFRSAPLLTTYSVQGSLEPGRVRFQNCKLCVFGIGKAHVC